MHSIYRESGKVSIDPGTCKQCGMCAKICPAEVLAMDDGNISVRSDSLLGCIACGHCMMVCPEGAIAVTGRGISPDDLLPLPAHEKRAGADELAALMESRRSVRRFSDQEVEADFLERVVEMASTGPMGIPPWDVGCVTVRGRDQVQRLAGEVIKGYEGFLKIFKPWLLTMMRPFVGQAKYDIFAHFVRPLAETYVRGHREGYDLVFYDAPALLIFHHSAYADVADAMIACTYAMLAAESLGLGNTIIGGAAPILQRNKTLCQKLGVPAGNKPSVILILGHPATHFRRAIRRRFSSVGTVSRGDDI
jgi:nitroreductase/Pyruvate/2-oxoacid:ferredoxin oxidoreductase delta subunit